MIRHRERQCMNRIQYCAILLTLLLFLAISAAAQAIDFPGPAPGTARAQLDGGRLVLGNDVIEGVWTFQGEQAGLVEVVNRISGRKQPLKSPEAFMIELSDGSVLCASQFKAEGEPVLERLAAEPQSERLASRSPGWKASLTVVSPDGSLRVRWEIVLRDGSNYLQQKLALQPTEDTLGIRKVTMIDAELPSAAVCGEGVGSPVAAGDLFLACEHPMANNRVAEERVICSVPRYRSLAPGQAWTVSSVVGVVPNGQLRRGFLYYLERQRARPYHPLFYYISWFDIAYDDRKMSEQLCLQRIEEFGRETAVKRGVKPDLFVFDDGWDDNQTLWRFHEEFPNGFSPLKEAAAKYGAALGTWISPWGGYSRAKTARLQYGREQGFEMAHGGFSLAGPTYYARFRDVCMEHAEEYGVRYFKFDGIGKGASAAGPGEQFGADIEAMLDLIAELRGKQPDLFFNTTVGTWPSPYWLFFSDSIWRGDADLSYHGTGTRRQQWLTFRDKTAYHVRIRKAPLYPVNSIKSQGVMYAELGLAAELSQDLDDLIDDIRIAAASGTQVQEYFVTPSMMPAEAWDAAAEAIAWVRENSDVLVDSHWIGGDPAKGEIYGYGSWAPRKGILALRNPVDKPQDIAVDLKTMLELPTETAGQYRIVPRWQKGTQPEVAVDSRQSVNLRLAPFELIVLECVPLSDRGSGKE